MKKNVLLVEDDPALRMVMREVLKDEFTVDEADNGADGIDKGLSTINDLIILDYQLPKKSGLEVIEAVKNAHPNVPVIVLTGYLNAQSEAQFNELGAAKIFPKPFNYRDLLEVVRTLTLVGASSPEVPEVKKAFSQQASFAAPQTSFNDQGMLPDSLSAISHLAEKVEFLQSITEKYWIEPNDIQTIREAVRCMETEVQKFYGKLNNHIFNSGQFASPLINQVRRPCLASNN